MRIGINEGLRNLNAQISPKIFRHPIKSMTVIWVRHLSRMREMRNAYKNLVCNSVERRASFLVVYFTSLSVPGLSGSDSVQ
jgi:hypothetical protein